MKAPNAPRLIDVLPREFGAEFFDAPAFRFAEEAVAKIYRRGDPDWRPWPDRHRNVNLWVVLDNGRAVGWNENPSRGYSFPVARRSKTRS